MESRGAEIKPGKLCSLVIYEPIQIVHARFVRKVHAVEILRRGSSYGISIMNHCATTDLSLSLSLSLFTFQRETSSFMHRE